MVTCRGDGAEEEEEMSQDQIAVVSRLHTVLESNLLNANAAFSGSVDHVATGNLAPLNAIRAENG